MATETPKLFDLPDATVGEKSGTAAKVLPRVLIPNRLQTALRASDLESLLPEGHRARMV